MNPSATSDRPYSSASSTKALASPSNSDMWVCMPEPCTPASGLGMKVANTPLLGRDLLDHQPDRHHGVGHGQGVGVAQVDLVLAGGVLVLGVLDRDAHLLEGEHGPLAQVAGPVGDRQLEVRAGVEQGGGVTPTSGRVGCGEVEELDLGGGVEGEALVPGPLEAAPQHVAGVTLERGPVEVGRCRRTPGPPPRRRRGYGQELEGLGVGAGQHVALLDPAEAVDGRAVEGHALVEGVLQLGRRDVEGLGGAEDVGEPELDEADAPLLDGPQHVVLLAFHSPPRRSSSSFAGRPACARTGGSTDSHNVHKSAKKLTPGCDGC